MRFDRGKRETDGGNAGFILVAVLWVLAALAGLVVVYVLYLRQNVYAEPLYVDRLQANAAAQAAVELSAYRLGSQTSQPSRDAFEFSLHRARVNVRSQAENARIDLNMAPAAVLTGLFTALGANASLGQELARRITDWRGGANGRPFQHAYELAPLLKDHPEFLHGALAAVTVYNGQPSVNLLAAPATVVAALPGMTPDRLYALRELRDSAPRDVLTARLGPAADFVTLVPSDTVRVHMSVDFPSDRASFEYEAVILLLRDGSEPYRVLSWRSYNGLDPVQAAGELR